MRGRKILGEQAISQKKRATLRPFWKWEQKFWPSDAVVLDTPVVDQWKISRKSVGLHWLAIEYNKRFWVYHIIYDTAPLKHLIIIKKNTRLEYKYSAVISCFRKIRYIWATIPYCFKKSIFLSLNIHLG